MDVEGKARQAEMWSESKDGAGKERRRGWNKQRRCGDLLREKQMLCFIYILYWERERKDELESAPPLQHTAIKAVRKEENDWQTTMSGSGLRVWVDHVHAHEEKWTFRQHTVLAQMARFASLPLLTSMFGSSSTFLVASVCRSVPVSPFFLLKISSHHYFFFFPPVCLARQPGTFPAGQNWQVYFSQTTCHLGWVGVRFLYFLCEWVKGITRQGYAGMEEELRH